MDDHQLWELLEESEKRGCPILLQTATVRALLDDRWSLERQNAALRKILQGLADLVAEFSPPVR
jgi:hypothetical protein